MHQRIADAYSRARQRLLLLDYDGTLASYAPNPGPITPNQELLSLLSKLAQKPATAVAIVSGRSQAELEAAFDHLPVGMAAEHGFFLKESGGQWHAARTFDNAWKKPVRALMQAYAAQLPGVLIEEKAVALVWHYRQAAAARAHKMARKLHEALGAISKDLGVRVTQGHKIVEVRLEGVHKGLAALHWLQQNDWDFVLAAGDDTTDEDLFRFLPAHAHTIKIGHGHTRARHRLDSPKALHQLLAAL